MVVEVPREGITRLAVDDSQGSLSRLNLNARAIGSYRRELDLDDDGEIDAVKSANRNSHRQNGNSSE
eukprot:SAG11_NODE_770_length_7257_cov_2.448449_9_plen_67_part_00